MCSESLKEHELPTPYANLANFSLYLALNFGESKVDRKFGSPMSFAFDDEAISWHVLELYFKITFPHHGRGMV